MKAMIRVYTLLVRILLLYLTLVALITLGISLILIFSQLSWDSIVFSVYSLRSIAIATPEFLLFGPASAIASIALLTSVFLNVGSGRRAARANMVKFGIAVVLMTAARSILITYVGNVGNIDTIAYKGIDLESPNLWMQGLIVLMIGMLFLSVDYRRASNGVNTSSSKAYGSKVIIIFAIILIGISVAVGGFSLYAASQKNFGMRSAASDLGVEPYILKPSSAWNWVIIKPLLEKGFVTGFIARDNQYVGQVIVVILAKTGNISDVYDEFQKNSTGKLTVSINGEEHQILTHPIGEEGHLSYGLLLNSPSGETQLFYRGLADEKDIIPLLQELASDLVLQP